MEDFKRLLAYAKPYKRFWPGYLILSILSVIFGVVNYALIDPLLTVLFQPQTMDVQLVKPAFSLDPAYFEEIFSYYLTKVMTGSGMLKGLMFVCAFFVVASLLSNITRYLSQRILVNMRTYIMQNIRRDLFKKISGLHRSLAEGASAQNFGPFVILKSAGEDLRCTGREGIDKDQQRG